MRLKPLLPACLLLPLLAPAPAQALEVELQGIRLAPASDISSCVEIAGDYWGVSIIPNEPGKIPRICYNSARINSITILNVAMVAQHPIKSDIVIKFEHQFPTGINGKIMARSKVQGFFSTENGLGTPIGAQISLNAFFSQAGSEDSLAEPFTLTVGEEMDSALFDFSAKEQYLASGPRVLKGIMKVRFIKLGQKLTLSEKSTISIDSGTRMEDKLETLAPPDEEETDAPSPADTGLPEGSKAPTPEMPFPSPSLPTPGDKTPPPSP
jgi:hypothetical protein